MWPRRHPEHTPACRTIGPVRPDPTGDLVMKDFAIDRRFVFVCRLLMGWVFLYAGLSQVLSHDFTTTQFLSHTKTFHSLYEPLTSPMIAPYLTFVVSWGHLLIGLSLVSGLLVRVSGPFGIALMLTYWT